MSSVKTSGQLRGFLLNAMQEVAAGKLSVERAASVTRTAAQVNESIYAELKAKQIAKSLGEKYAAFGAMDLGGEA